MSDYFFTLYLEYFCFLGLVLLPGSTRAAYFLVRKIVDNKKVGQEASAVNQPESFDLEKCGHCYGNSKGRGEAGKEKASAFEDGCLWKCCLNIIGLSFVLVILVLVIIALLTYFVLWEGEDVRGSVSSPNIISGMVSNN